MKTLALFFGILITICNFKISAQTREYNVVEEEEKIRKQEKLLEIEEELIGLTFHFNYSMSNSSAFLDGRGDSKSRFIDTTTSPGDEIQYAYTSKHHRFLFGGEYQLNHKTKLRLDIPITFYTHEENFLDISPTGSVVGQFEKYDESKFQIDYISLTANYELLSRSFFSDAYISVFVPTATKENLTDLNSFSRYSPFEIIPGLVFGTKSSRASMIFDVGYRLRSGLYSDMIKANLDLLLTSVPDTEVRTFVHNGISASKINEEVLPDIRNNVYGEIYSNFGFAFKILIEKVFSAEFIYQIVVFGKNTRAGSGYTLAVSLHL